MKSVGKHSVLGASGEISDFQEILRYLDELILHDNMWDDGNSLGPKEVHNYLTHLMYNRRNKFNPLWNSLVFGGVKNGQKYLGSVNLLNHFVILIKSIYLFGCRLRLGWCLCHGTGIMSMQDNLLDKHKANDNFGDGELQDIGRPLKSLVVVISWACLLTLGPLKLFQWFSILSSWKGLTFSAVSLAIVIVLMQILSQFSQSERYYYIK